MSQSAGDFYLEHQGLFEVLFRSYASQLPRHLHEDLRQAGALGLVEGLLSYDPEKGAQVGYVFDQVRTAMRSFSRAEARTLGRNDSLEGAVEEEDFDATDQTARTPDDLVHQLWCEGKLRRLVKALPTELMRRVAYERFVLCERTVRELAHQLNVTEARVRHLQSEAASIMRERFTNSNSEG